MKKYLYVISGIVLLIIMFSVIYFFNLPTNVKSIEQTNVVSGNDFYFEKATFDIELTKPIKGVKYFVFQIDNDEEYIKCEVESAQRNTYQVSLDILFFENHDYKLIGYIIYEEIVYFNKPLDFKINQGEPFKILEFIVPEEVNLIGDEVVIEVKLFNPLKANISAVTILVGQNELTLNQDSFELSDNFENNVQLLTIHLLSEFEHSEIIQLISIEFEYQDKKNNYYPHEQLLGHVNLYQEILIYELSGPKHVYYESKGFSLKIILIEEVKNNISGFIIKLDDQEIEVEIDQMNTLDEYNEYLVYVQNPHINKSSLKVKVVGLMIDGKDYKISSQEINISVKKALSNCVLKSKSSTVMNETRHAFYLECEEINNGVNLYKFTGKFNGEPFVGYNYIGYHPDMQESTDFAIIDVRNNVISLLTLPVERKLDEPYCSLEIDRLYYFYDNQENIYEVNQTLWVIPEEVIIVVKDFKTTKQIYNPSEEIPRVQLELLISSSILIEKIVLDVNGELIETNVKNENTKNERGTYLFELISYRPSDKGEFLVKIHSIIYNGQGTIKTMTGFTNQLTYKTS